MALWDSNRQTVNKAKIFKVSYVKKKKRNPSSLVCLSVRPILGHRLTCVTNSIIPGISEKTGCVKRTDKHASGKKVSCATLFGRSDEYCLYFLSVQRRASDKGTNYIVGCIRFAYRVHTWATKRPVALYCTAGTRTYILYQTKWCFVLLVQVKLQ